MMKEVDGNPTVKVFKSNTEPKETRRKQSGCIQRTVTETVKATAVWLQKGMGRSQ